MKRPIKARIRAAYYPGISYHELLELTFPPAEYPDAWHGRRDGGPPGCAMAFGRALREMRASIDHEERKILWIPPEDAADV